MSKRDEVARIVCSGLAPGTCPHICEGCETDADAILALLSDPDDRMVEAAARAIATDLGVNPDELITTLRGSHPAWELWRASAEAAIRAAMKAAGE